MPLVRDSSSVISEDGLDRLGKALEWTLLLMNLSATTTKRREAMAGGQERSAVAGQELQAGPRRDHFAEL